MRAFHVFVKFRLMQIDDVMDLIKYLASFLMLMFHAVVYIYIRGMVGYVSDHFIANLQQSVSEMILKTGQHFDEVVMKALFLILVVTHDVYYVTRCDKQRLVMAKKLNTRS